MDEMFDRWSLSELKPEQIAPLTVLFSPEWPEVWRDLATSHYVTLLSAPGSQSVAPPVLAQLAVALTLGIAQDLGGSQPYIPVGSMLAANAKARCAVEMRGQGASYRDVAFATGLTESRVRQIETEWRRQQMAERQGRLPLE